MVDVHFQISSAQRATHAVGTLRTAGFTAGQRPSGTSAQLNQLVVFRVADDKVDEVKAIVKRIDPGYVLLSPRATD